MTDNSLSENYKILKGPVKFEKIKILNGANYFSGGPVVMLRIDLAEYDEVFSNEIPGFYKSLKKLIPSLHEHFCSVGKPGGFFLRVKEGTLLGHIAEHVAIEIQSLAGMEVGFGKTRMTNVQGVYNVVFRYVDEHAGIFAAKAALNLVNSILINREFNVNDVVNTLIEIRERRLLGVSTQAIVVEAERREIPFIRLDKYNRVQLGTGIYRKEIRATITDETSLIAVETADNKFLTTSMLEDAGVPVPKRMITEDLKDVFTFYDTLQKPIVLKPAVGYEGKRVSVNLQDKCAIQKAFYWAKEYDNEVIAQELIPGKTYRILVINNKFVAAVQLEPPFIVGDGEKTVQELINELNEDPNREIGDKGKLSKVDVEENTLKILEINALDLHSVLSKEKLLYLKNSGNMRIGGTSIDVTNNVNPFNKFICERISSILNLNVAGIDVISEDINLPIIDNGGKVIEVNAAPDFRMHINPTWGEPRYVQKQFVEMLFPENRVTKIPLFSVTGSKGKSLTVDIINSCFIKMGFETGVISSKGLFVNGNCLKSEDATNSKNAEIILKDPTIALAIFETPVESILNDGLGYKYADFGIVLNIEKEHQEYYEYDHIRDVEDVAYAKSVVAEEVYEEGFTILNADDVLVKEMVERLYSNLVLFSKDYNNKDIKKCVENGGVAIVVDDGKIVILNNSDRIELMFLSDIPLFTQIQENYVYDSVLASVAAMYLFSNSVEVVREVLKGYIWAD